MKSHWLRRLRGMTMLSASADPETGRIQSDSSGESPSRIGDRYVVDRVLGRSDTSCVLQCRDERLSMRPVVVKIFLGPSLDPRQPDESGWARRHFEDECRILAEISHPNVVPILDRGRTPNGQSYLVTPYVDGMTLRERIVPNGMEFGRTAVLLRQIGDALAHVHSHGVWHRDLKPENILVYTTADERERVQVIDYGIASQRTSASGAGGEFVTQVAGTLPYMAPEQFDGRPSAASDVFALGIIAFEMLTGVRPFDSTNPFHMPALHRRGPDRLPSKLRPAIPREVDEAILQSLAFEASGRPANPSHLAARIAAALEAAASGEPTAPNDGAKDNSVSVLDRGPVLEPAPAGGALPPDSKYYVIRSADLEFDRAIDRSDPILLIKGARQIGKTSLLGRGLGRVRGSTATVACVDMQSLGNSDLSSVNSVLLVIAETIADQVRDCGLPGRDWSDNRSANRNFERFVRRSLLTTGSPKVVIALDEADRLFPYDYASEVFGLFRSWHNARILEPSGPWSRLTLAISYATEAHLFITDPNQSPFNVGTHVVLEDFSPSETDDLDARWGSPLGRPELRSRLMNLVGGHPFLVQRALGCLTTRGYSLDSLEADAALDDGPFGSHLRRMLALISRDAQMLEAIRALLHGNALHSPEIFHRLRSGGFVSGDAPRTAVFRCGLYESYLRTNVG